MQRMIYPPRVGQESYGDVSTRLQTGPVRRLLEFRTFFLSLLDDVLDHEDRNFSVVGHPGREYPVSHSFLESYVFARPYFLKPVCF